MAYKYRTDRHRNGNRWRSVTAKNKIMVSNPCVFLGTQKLYHYTTLERAISILSTNKLFMGRLASMNDINESYRPLSTYIEPGKSSESKDKERLKGAEKQLQRIRQTSLSVDGEMPGFANPIMWGHYADRGEGICIVLDKKALIRKLKGAGGFHYGLVMYEKDFNPDITIGENPEIYFLEHMNEIFFKKSDCWKPEQEFRIIRWADNSPAYVDISGCVIALVMCYARSNDRQEAVFGSESHKKLQLLFPDYPILEWSTAECGSNLRDAGGNQWYPAPDHSIQLDVCIGSDRECVADTDKS